jgi:5-methylcytosine-specific restriction endonuclease McrA
VHNGIRPAQRARILQRDGRCVLCSSRDNLQVGHLLSVADGLAAGLADVELNHDGNLPAMCVECNLGVGRQSVFPWIAIPLIRAYMRRFGGVAG